MNRLPLDSVYGSRPYWSGWGVSALVHGMAITAAFALVSDLTLAPRPEPFRWNVAMVQPPAETQAEATAAPAEPAQPAPARPAPVPPPAPVETQPVVRTVEPLRTVETVQTVKPVEQVVRQEVKAVQPLVQATAQPEHRVEASRPVEAAAVHRQTVAEVHEAQPVRTEPVAAQTRHEASAQPVEAANPAVPVVETARPVASAPHVVEAPKPVAAPAPAVVAAVPAPVTKPVVEAAAAPAPPAPQERAAMAPSVAPAPPATDQAPAGEQVAMARPAPKADYGWLAESLWHKVHELKRYPHEARVKRMEGRVVLRVVINDEGHLKALDVVQSSGHEVLDRDAIEIIRQACPLKLKHPLGRPQVVVQVPINYRLDR